MNESRDQRRKRLLEEIDKRLESLGVDVKKLDARRRESMIDQAEDAEALTALGNPGARMNPFDELTALAETQRNERN